MCVRDALQNKWLRVLLCTLVVVFFLYLPVIQSGLFADDVDFVSRARSGTLWRAAIFTIDGSMGGGSWRPLSGALFALTIPWGAAVNHLISLALYGTLIVAIFFVGQAFGLSQRAAIIGAVLFAFVPAHAEPVGWIAARADLLAAVCGVLSMLLFARGRRYSALAFFGASLLAKEMWVLLPLVWLIADVQQKNLRTYVRWWSALGAVLMVWGAVRWMLTGYFVGGYSITSLHLGTRLQLMAEQIIGFFVGIGLWGPVQNSAVLFARSWLLVSIVIIVACAMFIWMRIRGTRSESLSIALCLLLAPIAVLVITFPIGMSWVGDQRFWLAPSVPLTLLFGVFFDKFWKHVFVRALLCAIIVWFIGGTAYNVNLFTRAGAYRERIITSWQQLPRSAQDTVTLLPDSYHGIHLFAEPFFSQTLVLRNIPAPRQVVAQYQACARRCTQEPVIFSTDPSGLSWRSPTPRLFSLTEAGMHKQLKMTKYSQKISFWDGRAWQDVSSASAENDSKPRY